LVPSINSGAADVTAGGSGTVAGAPGARSTAEISGSGVEHRAVNVLRLKAGAVNAAESGKTRHNSAIILLRLFIFASLADFSTENGGVQFVFALWEML
jgi:hypothetical protein